MVLTWPRKCVLLLGLVLVHAHVANNVGVSAQQQPLVISGVSFDLLSATPSPTPTSTPKSTKKSTSKLTMAPAIATTTTTPVTTAPVVATKKTPSPTSKKPAVNADAAVNADTAVNTATGSSSSAATSGGASSAGFSGTNSSSSVQPAVAPSASPSSVPVVSSAAPAPTTATPAPTNSHDCDATNTNLINKFYENNDVLEGDCAAANNYYRFPFEGTPSREQLINMSKTSACTVLMEALLQILPTECDFKRVALRSTAEAILQLAKDIKQKGTEALPSDKAITQAIETRRKDLLKIPATKSATVATAAGSKASGSAASKSADATTSSSSGSGWKIAKGITSVEDDGQHILMDKDLLVVGTWSDNVEDSANGTPAPATRSSSSKEQERTETLDTKTKTSGSGSLQFAALSVHAALLLSWVFL